MWQEAAYTQEVGILVMIYDFWKEEMKSHLLNDAPPTPQ